MATLPMFGFLDRSFKGFRKRSWSHATEGVVVVVAITSLRIQHSIGSKKVSILIQIFASSSKLGTLVGERGL